MIKLNSIDEAADLHDFEMNADHNLTYVATNHPDYADQFGLIIQTIGCEDKRVLLQIHKIEDDQFGHGSLEVMSWGLRQILKKPVEDIENSVFAGCFDYKEDYDQELPECDVLLFDNAQEAFEYQCELQHPKYNSAYCV